MRTGEKHAFYEFSAIVTRQKFQWPGGAHVAVLIVPNIEHFELNDERGRMDVRNFSRSDYGNRVAIWRMLEALDRHKIRASVALNASVCRHYPRIIEACLARDYEFLGHGLTNSQHLNETSNTTDSHAIVRQTVETIRSATGRSVRGWLGPGMGEVDGTLDVLKECGIEYVCDWGPADDQPFRMNNGLYVMPYSIDLNDMSIDRSRDKRRRLLPVSQRRLRHAVPRRKRARARAVRLAASIPDGNSRIASVISKRRWLTSRATTRSGGHAGWTSWMPIEN